MDTLLRNTFSSILSSVEVWCLNHMSFQFKYMTPVQVWNVISKIQNRNVSKQVCRKRKISEVLIDDLLLCETIHTCNECGGHDIINNQVQVRGADESMTQFLFCQSCGSMWKEE